MHLVKVCSTSMSKDTWPPLHLTHHFLWSSTYTGIWVWWVLKPISQNFLVMQLTYNWNRSWLLWIALVKWTQFFYLSNFTIFSKCISNIKMLSNTRGRALLMNVLQQILKHSHWSMKTVCPWVTWRRCKKILLPMWCRNDLRAPNYHCCLLYCWTSLKVEQKYHM